MTWKKLSPSEVNRIIADRKAGKSYSQLAAKHKRSITSVARILRGAKLGGAVSGNAKRKAPKKAPVKKASNHASYLVLDASGSPIVCPTIGELKSKLVGGGNGVASVWKRIPYTIEVHV